jgi:hypothetical protein
MHNHKLLVHHRRVRLIFLAVVLACRSRRCDRDVGNALANSVAMNGSRISIEVLNQMRTPRLKHFRVMAGMKWENW